MMFWFFMERNLTVTEMKAEMRPNRLTSRGIFRKAYLHKQREGFSYQGGGMNDKGQKVKPIGS